MPIGGPSQVPFDEHPWKQSKLGRASGIAGEARLLQLPFKKSVFEFVKGDLQSRRWTDWTGASVQTTRTVECGAISGYCFG